MREQLSGNPLAILGRWVDEAAEAGLPVPSTMTFATAGPDGPHARTVLVTAFDDLGLRFHTSAPTTKTDDLAADARCSSVFHWPALGRQVVLVGRASELDPAVAQAAYPTRPRQLQLVAWVYEELIGVPVAPGQVEEVFARWDTDPRSAAAPPSWRTISFVPERMDFWQAGTADTPPGKTRFTLVDGVWGSQPALP